MHSEETYSTTLYPTPMMGTASVVQVRDARMRSESYRVCEYCGSQYNIHVERCSGCGASLLAHSKVIFKDMS